MSTDMVIKGTVFFITNSVKEAFLYKKLLLKNVLHMYFCCHKNAQRVNKLRKVI